MGFGKLFKKKKESSTTRTTGTGDSGSDSTSASRMTRVCSDSALLFASTSTSTSKSKKTHNGRRSLKKRHQVISQFLQVTSSSSATSTSIRSNSTNGNKNHIWKESDHSEGATSVESSSHHNVNGDTFTSLHRIRTSNVDVDGVCFNDGTSDTASSDSQASHVPEPKSVRFTETVVSQVFIVENCHYSQDEEKPDKRKLYRGHSEATLQCSHGVLSTASLPHYDINELYRAQPKKRVFLTDEELTQLRHQKERLNKFRKKVKKKHQKARKERTQIKLELANEAIVKAQQRQQRIIDQYKMAAPSAQQHRVRRRAKYILAHAARTVALVQRRQTFLNSIVQAANALAERRNQQQEMLNDMLPKSIVRRQHRKIWALQASTKARVRLYNKKLVMEETTRDPVMVPFKNAIQEDSDDESDCYYDTDDQGEYSDDDDDDDDDDLDCDDLQYRRLEWAVISFLAAAKTKAPRSRSKTIEV
ncbi:expressed unknown protein [Seminavis robusta]|uniref:Uncharacterized protein n=1 Tax=Seminavis robusta TaxID=568900 RepID=A0A9N8DIG1_9STRA|nr:expressed unknown protein [Seminavis robusta]|eukprot:Sro175_g077170.1 n/a (475) ;mRNA; r:92276-93700